MPLTNCNEAQMRAVQHFLGPMLLIAGPGSGKTFTIIERIRYLIEEHNIEPSQILIITFTKAAAFEMEQRFQNAMKGKNYSVNFGTFHAVYFHILKQTYQYTSQNIISEKEKREYLKQIIKGVNENVSESELIEHLLNEFGKVKNSIEGIENYHYKGGLLEPEEFKENYRCYRKICLQEQKMDFDDMALQCMELFRKRPDILEIWQKRFSFIMIDEFQDINSAQYIVVKMLSGKYKNLIAVGDDDQSIYGFRGADSSIMKKFLEDFVSAKTVMLEQNYRSAEPVIQFSMQLIKENSNRFSKTIQAGTKKAGQVSIRNFLNKEEEYHALITNLKEYQTKERLKDCAVICRTNRGAGEIKEVLKKAGIAFMGKESQPILYDHFIIKDFEDYIRFARGERERSRFLRIMNKPSRFFTRDSVSEDTSFEKMKQYYSGKTEYIKRISELDKQMKQLKDLPPYLAVNFIRKAVCYDEYLKEKGDKSEKFIEIADLIQKNAAAFRSTEEWLLAIEKYRRQNAVNEKTPIKDRREDKAAVLTMHGAKGLEYDTVFIPDVNDGMVPFGRQLSKEEEEEERRIFYVAVTRAKTRLEIMYLENDRTKPSRFLPKACNETNDRKCR